MARIAMLPFTVLLIFVSLSRQQKDPLNDFCRRFGHQSTVVDRRLYIDGGLVDWNPISSNPLNYSNTWLLYNDLDVTNQGMPQLHSDLNKNSTIPDVSGGVLWADEVNKVWYQFGGEFDNDPEDFTLWTYDIINNDWYNLNDQSDKISRVAWGAGVAVSERAEGYYLGGYISNATVPGYAGPTVTTSNLIRYDMTSNTWTNNTGPDNTGRAEGVMVFLPASDNGILIYFGGILDTFGNGTYVGSSMSEIYVYDIASTKWYTQTATGDIPGERRRFCAGAAWPDDHSSYNIYLYGGAGIPGSNNSLGYDDVYILSIPSFTWIKWWPTQPGPGNPHHSLTCNVIDNSQMIIIGGYSPEGTDCDAPTIWGTHNLNLGENGPDNAMWDLYYPNITSYAIPPEIIAKIGGGSGGGATVKQPQNWDNRDLAVYFTRVPQFAARTPTRSIPGPTSSATSTPAPSSGGKKSNAGAIAGGVVGGVVGLAIIIALVLLCLRHRRRHPKDPNAIPPKRGNSIRAELPATAPTELSSERKVSSLDNQQNLPHLNTAPAYHDPNARSPSGHLVSPQWTSPGATHMTGVSQHPTGNYFPMQQVSSPPPQAGWGPPQQYGYAHPPQGGAPPYAPPYDPNDPNNALHHQQFQPPPTPQPARTISSATSDAGRTDSVGVGPPTASNTPAHFYPQSTNVSASPGSTKRGMGRFVEEDG